MAEPSSRGVPATGRPGTGSNDIYIYILLLYLKDHFDITPIDPHGAFDVSSDPPRQVEAPKLLEVVWADDLALAYRCRQAQEIVPAMQHIMSEVFQECLKHGLVPNLKKGPKGPGCKQVKTELFGVEEPSMTIPGVPEGFHRVRLIPQYKHLGTRIHVGNRTMNEIKARMGQAWTVYRRFRRQIFQNKLLSLKRRIFLFRSLVMIIFEYNIGTWGRLLESELKYFSKRLHSFYRGLIRAEVPELELRLWSQDRVRAYVQLPGPQELLHCARMRYSLSLYSSAPDTLWTLVGCENRWLSLLREAHGWFFWQLRGYGPDSVGNEWRPNLHEWCLHAGKSMRSWIRKAMDVSNLNHARWTEWREWHFNTLVEMIENGLKAPMPWPSDEGEGRARMEACLLCRRTFRGKAAWAVHAFKSHGRLNKARGLVGGSRCDACAKEYHTSTRLQDHLCYSRRCYESLLVAGKIYEQVLPGKNNKREQHPPRFVIPQRSEGPQEQRIQNANIDEAQEYDWPLMEAIMDSLLVLDRGASIEDCVDAIKSTLETSCNNFEEVRRTLGFLSRSLDEEEADMGWAVGHDRVKVAAELAYRRCTLRWFFEEADLVQDPRDEEIRNAAASFASSNRTAAGWSHREDFFTSVPRFRSSTLVFLHLFSGERRKGDIQSFLENMEAPAGYCLHILSVDVIFDSIAGDLANFRNQRRWLAFAREGLIAGIFSGPPCESWSRARLRGGIAGHSKGDGGPRVLRTAEHMSGLETVRVQEAQQLLLANRLLLFTLSLFHTLLQLRRFMLVEHPECPSGRHEDWMASIWKLFVVRSFLQHRDVRLLSVLQGRYGGLSPKPTSLMVLYGGKFDVHRHMEACTTSESLPPALVMGWNQKEGEYQTASLKSTQFRSASAWRHWRRGGFRMWGLQMDQRRRLWWILYSLPRSWPVVSTKMRSVERTCIGQHFNWMQDVNGCVFGLESPKKKNIYIYIYMCIYI